MKKGAPILQKERESAESGALAIDVSEFRRAAYWTLFAALRFATISSASASGTAS